MTSRMSARFARPATSHEPARSRGRHLSVVRGLRGRMAWDRRRANFAGPVADRLPEGATVLDMGCGDESMARTLRRARPDLEITGLDVLPEPTTAIDAKEFDATTVPYDDHSFTAVTFVDVLHHTDDPMMLLAEAARVASGRVVITDHLADTRLARPQLCVMDWFCNGPFGVRLPPRYWTWAEWKRAFAASDLVIDEVSTPLNGHAAPRSWLRDRGLDVLWTLAPLRRPARRND